MARQRRGHEVVAIPGPEEGGGPDHQRVRHRSQHALLGLGLGASVDIQRARRRLLAIGNLAASVEHEIAGERHDPRPHGLGGGGDGDGAVDVLAPATVRIVLGLVDPDEAGRVDHRPRLQRAEERVRRASVGDVQVAAG